MADITVTAANVAATSNTVTSLVQVGESVTQAQPLYLYTTDNKYYKADADVLATSKAAGIALTPASTDGYVLMATDGLVNLGATLTVGQVYVASTTAGGIAPYSDLATGDYVTLLGVATTAALLDLQLHVSQTAKP